MPKKYMIYGILIVGVIALLGIGIYLQKNKNKKTIMNKNTVWSQDQEKAIRLADQELLKHFPDNKFQGDEYKVTMVYENERPASTLNRIFTVVYDLADVEDAQVTILVDLTAQKVISYKKTKV